MPDLHILKDSPLESESYLRRSGRRWGLKFKITQTQLDGTVVDVLRTSIE